MKNIITTLLCFVTIIGFSQNQKADTLVLSVYNNNSRYMLTLADFGPTALTQSITGDMVAAYDTMITIKGKADSTKNKDPRFDITRSCNKPLGDVKNKIVIMDLNKDCDVTMMCLNVQRAGAKALVIVHNSNSNGNIKLPKQGLYKDSMRIPVFTIRKELGERIGSMMPSLVGISLRVANNNTANLVQNPIQNIPLNTQSVKGINALTNAINGNEVSPNEVENALNSSKLNGIEAETGLGISKPYMKLSPNPTRDIAYLNYGFPEAIDFQIAVKNAVGQVIFTQILRGVQIGTVELNTQGWANNIYIVEMRFGKEVIRQKLVVQR